MKGKLHKMVSGYILSLNGDIDDPYAIVNEELAKDHEWHKLSLKNCQAIERGYDLDELISESNTSHLSLFTSDSHELMYDEGFKVGFQKALELMGDKKFSEDDLRLAMHFGKFGEANNQTTTIGFIQSLQQTECDVEIVMEPCYYDDSLGGFSTSYKPGMPTEQPKLDSNNCLILRKI